MRKYCLIWLCCVIGCIEALPEQREHSAGKFALAAMQNARPTSAETLNPAPPAIASTIASAPTATAASFATQTSSRSETSRPLRTTLLHRSWATAPEAEITRPATTARIVASATAEITARKISPPLEPAPPPRLSASVGIARLPPLPAASSPAWPRIARAPTPTTMTIR